MPELLAIHSTTMEPMVAMKAIIKVKAHTNMQASQAG
jgi:hypothetical protein